MIQLNKPKQPYSTYVLILYKCGYFITYFLYFYLKDTVKYKYLTVYMYYVIVYA